MEAVKMALLPYIFHIPLFKIGMEAVEAVKLYTQVYEIYFLKLKLLLCNLYIRKHCFYCFHTYNNNK